MNLYDLFLEVLTDSGQFLFDPETIELKTDNFKRLVNSSVGFYNRHRPIERSFNVDASGTATYDLKVHEFGEPVEVSRAIPVVGFRPNFYFNSTFRGYRGNDQLRDPMPVPIEYRNGILYLPAPGKFDLTCVYNHELKYVNGEWVLDSITHDNDPHFFSHLTGSFMVALGRSRQAVTVQELPVEVNAADLIADGKEMIEKAEQSIQSNSKFYLGW